MCISCLAVSREIGKPPRCGGREERQTVWQWPVGAQVIMARLTSLGMRQRARWLTFAKTSAGLVVQAAPPLRRDQTACFVRQLAFRPFFSHASRFRWCLLGLALAVITLPKCWHIFRFNSRDLLAFGTNRMKDSKQQYLDQHCKRSERMGST